MGTWELFQSVLFGQHNELESHNIIVKKYFISISFVHSSNELYKSLFPVLLFSEIISSRSEFMVMDSTMNQSTISIFTLALQLISFNLRSM